MNFYTVLETDKYVLKLLQCIDNGYMLTENELQELSKISELNFSNFQLTNLPDSIGKLSSLTRLYVGRNQLTSLPDSIGKLSQLKELYVSSNHLISLPDSIGELSQLKELYVSNNQLTSLPDSIGELSQLIDLNVYNNQLTSLPDSIRKLSKLTNLKLQNNCLQEIPSCIRQLSSLEKLNISSNPLKTLPDWIGEMTKLRNLDLSSLRLTEFPESILNIDIPFLTKYDIEGLAEIYIKDTELSIQPVSLFDQSRDASDNFQQSRKLIKDYFETPKIPIREAKVIFLGDGKVGKTYTIQRLLHDCRRGDYPTKETHGILIEDLYTKKDGKSYKVRVWDFGGQDIMHEMHRCFLTDRTCYVVMVDTRVDKQTGRARYWLRTVQSVAPNAPTLLLVNEISGGKNRDLDYSGLKREFPNLVGAEYCSSKDASDEDFRQRVECAIFQKALDLDSCKMELPKSWEGVRQNLLRLRGGADPAQTTRYYIDRQMFHELCDQYKVPADEGLRAWLLTWFNDLGVCFSYHLSEDGREQSSDYKILDPMWLTSAVYKIIWEKERTDDGLISLSEIYRILEQPGSDAMKKDGIPCLENVTYNEIECGYVLDIMRMFRISYPADKNTEFMPTLCKPDSKMDPVPQQWVQHVTYKFRYTFLPENVLHRLMIYCFANLRPGKRWRRGFWLESETQGLSAVIQSTGRDSEENELQIDVYAQKEQHEAWTWLQPLCQKVAEINNTLSLKAEVFVLAENQNEKKWFLLDSIWHWWTKGVQNMQGERELFPIQPLMNLIYGKYLQSQKPPEMFLQTATDRDAGITRLDLSKPFDEQMEKDPIKEEIDLQKKRIDALRENTDALKKNTLAVEKNTLVVVENTLTTQQANVLLQAIRNGEVTLPPEVMTALAGAFHQSDEPVLKAAEQKMRSCSWENKRQMLRELLGDAANFATIAPIIVQLGKNYGPILLELVKTVVVR